MLSGGVVVVGWDGGFADGDRAVLVRDSDPAAELAETEIKLAALLPLLAG